MKKRANKLLCVFLALVLVVGLLPISVQAEGEPVPTGDGTEESPYVYTVSDAETLNAVVSAINNDESDTTKYVISVQADIACTGGIHITRNEVTVLGNGHTLDFGSMREALSVQGGTTRNPVLNLGDKNDPDNTLILKSSGTDRGPAHFITVASSVNGSDQGTLRMYDGVTITGSVTDNFFGGAVIVGARGVFEMNGGLITKCGVESGIVCFGGGVAVIGGGTFVMRGGAITECFARTDYDHGWQVPSGAGGGVFVGQGSTFIMEGGSISGNYASADGGGVAVIASASSYYANGRNWGYLDSKFVMSGGSISGNTAGKVGGGLAALGTYIDAPVIGAPALGSGAPTDPGVYISGGTFEGNEAPAGGGILLNWIQPTIPVQIYDSTIAGNKAEDGAGIYIMSYWTQADIDGCTIQGNQASEEGGGIYLNNNTNCAGTTLSDTVITGNTAGNDQTAGYGGGIYAVGSSIFTFEDNCAVYGNSAVTGADDIYKDDSAVMVDLPTAADMGATTGKRFSGWYWDYETVAGDTYEYPDGVSNPCERYDPAAPVAYTPVATENAKRYLKAVEVETHTVSFDLNYDGAAGAPAAQRIPDGDCASEPEEPRREGYTFTGWYTAAACAQTDAYAFTTPVGADLVLYAGWSRNAPYYTLQYGDGRPNDGAPQNRFPYDPANPVKLPSEVKYFSQEEIADLPDLDIYGNVVSEGNYFLAWFSYMPASRINPNYRIYEKTGTNSYRQVESASDPAKTYYQFIPCEQTPGEDLGEVTYYAQWVKVKIDIEVKIDINVDISYSQTFGGKIVTIEDSQKTALAKNISVRDIVGDNCEIELIATVSNPKDEREQSMTAEYIAQNYPECQSIGFDVEIRKNITSGGVLYSSEVLKELRAPIEIRFSIPDAWQDGTVKMLCAHTEGGVVTVSQVADMDTDSKTYTLYSDMFSTYTMLYIPNSSPAQHTLTYDTQGGTALAAETFVSGAVVVLTRVPAREGYTFTGWYADAACTTPVSQVQMDADVTVYAGWRRTDVPEILNGDDHIAYVIGYADATLRPERQITRAEVAVIFFRLLEDEVRTQNLTAASAFRDVTEEMWCNTAVSTMSALGIVKGRTAEFFDPATPITRGEFAAICARFDASNVENSCSFSDIDGHWAAEEIRRAAALGWILGYPDDTFRPDEYISRAEAVTMINRVLQRLPETPEDLADGMTRWSDNLDTSAWYYLAVQEATNSHHFVRKTNGYENWTGLKENPDWTLYQ